MDEALHSKDVARPARSARPANSAFSGEREYPRFPGCHAVRISRAEIRTWEGRIEFWDADTEIAMVCEPTSWYHEVPGQRLAKLAGLIAAARGSQIEAAGSSDLLLRNERREWWRIMQPDQMLFLNQRESEPAGLSVEVGLDRLPDVVLEVDNTTDVRRGKLGLSVTPVILEQLARAGFDSATAIRAALACRSEEDFVRRIRPAGR